VTNIDDESPSDRKASTQDYDYDSDSDLDEEDCWAAYKPSKPLGLSIGVDDNPNELSRATHHSSRPEDMSVSTSAELPESFRIGRLGRVVHVPGTAHATWKAYIFYLCTGEISFRPLRSSPKSQQSRDSQSEINHNAPPCSPKSMYWLIALESIP